MLQQVLAAQPDLTPAQRSAITEWTAAAVGAIAGGRTGAATALDNVEFNYLNHEELRQLADAELACYANDKAACERAKQLHALDGERDNAARSCKGLECVAILADAQAAYASLARAYDKLDPQGNPLYPSMLADEMASIKAQTGTAYQMLWNAALDSYLAKGGSRDAFVSRFGNANVDAVKEAITLAIGAFIGLPAEAGAEGEVAVGGQQRGKRGATKGEWLSH